MNFFLSFLVFPSFFSLFSFTNWWPLARVGLGEERAHPYGEGPYQHKGDHRLWLAIGKRNKEKMKKEKEKKRKEGKYQKH